MSFRNVGIQVIIPLLGYYFFRYLASDTLKTICPNDNWDIIMAKNSAILFL